MVNISLNFDLFNNYYYFYERLIVLLFSLVPSLLIVWFILYSDRKDKEPKKNIIICLLSGILTISLAGYFEQLVANYFSNQIILTIIWALIEEISKVLIFFMFIFDNKHYDDIYDGVVYMTLISLSFAGLENIMYAFSESTISNSVNLAIMRDFTTIPLHLISSIVIGYFLSLGNFSKDNKNKNLNFFKAIFFGTVIHAAFNLLMGFLGSLNVDLNNVIQTLLLQTFPILAIMVILFYIAYKVLRETLNLNKSYVNNGKFEEKYSYLMNYKEYLISSDRKKRVDMYNVTKVKNKKG